MSKHKIFSLPTRVYFHDTDAGGVVYHGSYVNFMERARTEWLRDVCGFSNGALMQEFGAVFVVRSMHIEYLKPALLDDMLAVTAEVKEIGRSSVILTQTVMRGDELLTRGEVHLVCVALETFKPVSVPQVLREKWKN